ncbi:MAG: endolytic transglycosylase MltG, partial [Polyangiaceae bacterium]
PRPAPVRRRGSWALLAFAAAAVAASSWLFILYPSERGPGDGRAVEVAIPAGTDAGHLAAILGSSGLVTSPHLFVLWVRATGGAGAIVPGSHLLTDDASPRELLARLERRPGGGSVRVTFPEGWTRFDMARRLQDRHVVGLRDFLDATTDPALLHELGVSGDSAEGFLFPATYELSLDSDARDVVRRMKREFDHRWDTLSHSRSSSLNDVMTSAGLDVRGVVTLASMVEKEAAVDDERPLIASVFLNRLRDPAFHPRRLECDPTASYGCLVAPEKAASCAGFTGKATAAIEHDPDNPYSTYTHEGLPPGPIANPGARALEAVMAPASTRFFYFVARGDGHSTFSETYEAHAGAVRDGGRRGP